MAAPTRILICEDSATYALGLKNFLQAGEDLDVVGVCPTGEETLEALPRLKPDLVTMDLELPGMGGLRAVEEIMRTYPVPILVLSGHVRRGSAKAVEALAAGALEALPKTHLRLDEPDGASAVALRHRFKRLARTRVDAPIPEPARTLPAPFAGRPNTRATAVGIVVSTGGPRALQTVLAGLPADFPVPVLVVQHMAAGFLEGLVGWLDQRVPLPVRVARDGQPARPGISFAPDNAHLTLDSALNLVLDRETDVGHHRPSADLLLQSLASSAGAGAIGVVLTGMGRDGALGVAALRRAEGRVIAQDEATSAVFGMPRAAAEAGAEAVLPLDQIAGALVGLVTGRAAA